MNPADGVTAFGKTYHRNHIKCAATGKDFTGGGDAYEGTDGKVYCQKEWERLFQKREKKRDLFLVCDLVSHFLFFSSFFFFSCDITNSLRRMHSSHQGKEASCCKGQALSSQLLQVPGLQGGFGGSLAGGGRKAHLRKGLLPKARLGVPMLSFACGRRGKDCRKVQVSPKMLSVRLLQTRARRIFQTSAWKEWNLLWTMHSENFSRRSCKGTIIKKR